MLRLKLSIETNSLLLIWCLTLLLSELLCAARRRISLLMTIVDEGCSENGATISRGDVQYAFGIVLQLLRQDDNSSLFGVVVQDFKLELVSTKLDPFRSDGVKDNVFVKKDTVRRRVVFL